MKKAFALGALCGVGLSLIIFPRPIKPSLLSVSSDTYIIATCRFDSNGIQTGEKVAPSMREQGQCSKSAPNSITIGVAMQNVAPNAEGLILMRDVWFIGGHQ